MDAHARIQKELDEKFDSVILDEMTLKDLESKGMIFKKVKLVKAYFEPQYNDLTKLAECITQSGCRTVLDVGCGRGDLINTLSMFAKNAVFKGIDTRFYHEPLPEAKPNVSFESNGIEAMAYSERFGTEVVKYDCVICAWMPHYSDWREMMCKLSNKLVILILSRSFNTGTIETYTGCEKFGFSFVKSWKSKDNVVQVWERAS